MTVGERIRERLEALGMSGAELARRVGLTQPTISALISGKSRGSAHLHKIARELQTTVDFLEGATDLSSPAATPNGGLEWNAPPAGRADDLVPIAVADVSYGLGGAYVDDASVEASIELFPRAFIRQFTRGPAARLYFATGIGDSMEPTIHSSDLVLVDRSQETLRLSDQLWAIHVGSIGMIKRVRVMPDGTVVLVSDNPNVRDYMVGQDELTLIGRVVAVVKKL